ncbi:Drug/metabolite transporter, partial [Globisporangium splendens]
MASHTTLESPIVHRASAASRASVSIAGEKAAASQQPAKKPVKKGSVFEWVVGCIFLVIVAVIWTFSSVLVQYIFDDLSFEAPFFLTYVGMSLFSVNLPIYYVTKILWPQLLGKKNQDQQHSDLPQLKTGEVQPPSPHSKEVLKPTLKASAIVAPLWFLANFTYNESLNMTSVTSSTILSATSTVFTLMFGVWILKERFTWSKLLGVALCMAGNISTIANDSSDSPDHIWGDVVALIGAIMYGVYTTAIRLYIPDNSGISISLFFGFLGFFSFLGLLAFVLIFNATGVESLANLTPKIMGLLIFQGLMNSVLADYLWAVAILYTSTTVATVGLSLTVPMAILSDWIVHGLSPGWVTIVSSVLVLGGFVVISLSTRQEQLEQTREIELQEQQEANAIPLTPVEPTAEYKELAH